MKKVVEALELVERDVEEVEIDEEFDGGEAANPAVAALQRHKERAERTQNFRVESPQVLVEGKIEVDQPPGVLPLQTKE